MSDSIWNPPQALLQDSFSDAGRHTVLVVGAGLHRQLGPSGKHGCDKSAAECFGLLADWNELITSVASDASLKSVRHADPSASWESLVAEMAKRESLQAGVAEKKLLQAVAAKLKCAQYSKTQIGVFGALLHERFDDVISLNIDDCVLRALQSALGVKPAKVSDGSVKKFKSHLATRYECRLGDKKMRVWFPHGIATKPSNIILGTRNYGMMLHELNDEFNEMKKWEAKSLPKSGRSANTIKSARTWKRTARKMLQSESSLTWVRLFMVCDLVFMGVGLDRAETDLWWALNQRQRNLARVSQSVRPHTFYVTVCNGDQHGGRNGIHLATGPAGIIPVHYGSWDDAWTAVLGCQFHG